MTLSFIASAPPSIPSVSSPVPLIRSCDVAHVERRIAAGDLTRVRRGILAPARMWSALAPWERYLARVIAVTMMLPDAVFSHESAAVLLGLPILGDPVVVHILDTPSATSRLHGGIRIHTTRDDREVLDLGGIRTTTHRDTVVDIARVRHPAIGLMVADAALRIAPTLSARDLVVANEGRSSSRGRRIARWPLHRANRLAETALESLSRAAIEWMGFDEPELQVEFRSDGTTDRVDTWWPEARIIGEADGDIKYDGSLQDPAAAIRAEKQRDRRLVAHGGKVVHWGWADVVKLEPLRSTLRNAGLRALRPEDSRQLRTLQLLLTPRPSTRTAPVPDPSASARLHVSDET